MLINKINKTLHKSTFLHIILEIYLILNFK